MFWPPLETVVTQPKQGKWNLDISWLRTCVPFAVHRTVRFYHNAVRAFRTGELETLYHFLKLSFSQNEFSVFKTGRFIILSNYRFVATRLYSVLEARTRGGGVPLPTLLQPEYWFENLNLQFYQMADVYTGILGAQVKCHSLKWSSAKIINTQEKWNSFVIFIVNNFEWIL